MEEKLKKLLEKLKFNEKNYLGYPINSFFDYSKLYPFLKYSINNIGSPYDMKSTNYKINTKELEVEVLNFFENILKADKKNCWGYVTNGGTEGNHYGLFVARETFPNAVVYYSDQVHYSIPKIIKIMRMKSIVIPSDEKGEINYDILKNHITSQKSPVIIVANIGTTMKGAIDNVNKIKSICENISHYIHCDAALTGMMLPFVENPQPFTFADGVDSISISGHKFIGSPVPCGIVLTKKDYVKNIGLDIEYIKSSDKTLSGSRNGFTPIILWYAINKIGKNGFTKMVEDCYKIADYTISKLKELGIHSWRNINSNIVVFEVNEISADIIKKWQIATQKNIGHIITMPNVKKERIDNLINDIKKLKQ